MPLGADVTFEERCVGEEGELRQLFNTCTWRASG